MQEIEESKQVISIFANWSGLFSSDSRKVSVDSLKKLFLSAAEHNDSIEYCLASTLRYLKSPLSFSDSRVKIIRGKAFSHRIPSEQDLKDIKDKYKFLSRAGDLYLDVPNYKPFYQKYL